MFALRFQGLYFSFYVWPNALTAFRASGGGDLGDGTSVRTLTFYTWWKEGTVDGMKRFTTKIVYVFCMQGFYKKMPCSLVKCQACNLT